MKSRIRRRLPMAISGGCPWWNDHCYRIAYTPSRAVQLFDTNENRAIEFSLMMRRMVNACYDNGDARTTILFKREDRRRNGGRTCVRSLLVIGIRLD